MPFISYSPNQEDVLLWHTLGKVDVGSILTISSTNQEDSKNELYSLQVTRSLSERGWHTNHLTVKDDILSKDISIRQYQDELALVNLLVISGISALSYAIHNLDWGKLSPNLVVINIDDQSLESPQPLNWRQSLADFGFEFARQISTTNFFSSVKAAKVHEELCRLLLCTDFVTEKQLNIQISHEELKLELHEAQELFAMSQKQAHEQYVALQDHLAQLAKSHFFIPRHPRAFIKRVLEKTFFKSLKK